MSQKVQLLINPDVYVAEFQKTIATHVADLRNTIRAIEDGSFVQRASAPRPNAVLQLQLDTDIHPGNDVVRACNSCFLDLIRTLIKYLDRMIAVKRCLNLSLPIPPGATNSEDILRVFTEYLEDTYQKVARDMSLSNPRKLQEFPELLEAGKRAALSYFSLRRCLEHHGGVSDADMQIHFLKPTILAGAQEITAIPFMASENTSINIRMDHETRVFCPGDVVSLSEADVEYIFFTLQAIIAPEVRRCLAARPTSEPTG